MSCELRRCNSDWSPDSEKKFRVNCLEKRPISTFHFFLGPGPVYTLCLRDSLNFFQEDIYQKGIADVNPAWEKVRACFPGIILMIMTQFHNQGRVKRGIFRILSSRHLPEKIIGYLPNLVGIESHNCVFWSLNTIYSKPERGGRYHKSS